MAEVPSLNLGSLGHLRLAARQVGALMGDTPCRELKLCAICLMEAMEAAEQERWTKMFWETRRAMAYLDQAPKGGRIAVMRRDAARLGLTGALMAVIELDESA